MSKVIDILEAERHFSPVLQDVTAAAEVVIASSGKPVARFVPIRARRRPKRLGLQRGRIEVPDDFNAPLPPQVLVRFEGRPLP